MAKKSVETFHFPNLLICEGPEDCAFFKKLIEVRKLKKQYHVFYTGDPSARDKGMRSGSITKFAHRLRSLKSSGQRHFPGEVRNILLIGDNDDDPDKNFNSIRKQVEDCFGFAPKAPETIEKGSIERFVPQAASINISIMILMLPEPKVEGCLECFCLESAMSANKDMAAKVEQFAAAVKVDKWQRENSQGKMKLRSNLAARHDRDPFIPLGQALRDHPDLIPSDHSSFDRIATIIESFGK